jgi:hypothetical protein
MPIGSVLRFSAHCRDYVSHEFSLQLVTQCLIPGSYALDAVATVRTRNQTERRFSMFRFKRYDEALLAESLARFGWEKLVSSAHRRVGPRAGGDVAGEAVARGPIASRGPTDERSAKHVDPVA